MDASPDRLPADRRHHLSRRAALVSFAVALGACAAAPSRVSGTTYIGLVQDGEASFYSDSLAGNHTASGAPYDPTAMTAAHRTLPFGTLIRVTRRDTGASVDVVVNDRGPYAGHDRILDLSRHAAHALAMESRGVAAIRLEVLAVGRGRRR